MSYVLKLCLGSLLTEIKGLHPKFYLLDPLPLPPHYAIFKNSFIDFLFICNISPICANLGLWIRSFDMLKCLERCNKHDMMQYEICHMKYAIWNMPYEICNMQFTVAIIHKLYAMANGNMLYTIYNVQYVICNLSVSFVKYLGNNCLSSLIFFTFETLPYTFILGYWLKFYGLFFTWVLWGVF